MAFTAMAGKLEHRAGKRTAAIGKPMRRQAP
jgi:hypothetical protein